MPAKNAGSNRFPPPDPPKDPHREQSGPKFAVVGVGASAGGLDALTQLLKALPSDTGMAFVLIQHLDPTHTSILTDLLARATVMPVVEVVDQMPVAVNRVFVIPPGMTMGLEGGVLRLSPRAASTSPHHSIDHFFRSLADNQGHRAIGVVLSGSATDGTLGLEAIKAEGGITFAQDDTAQHTSMPRSAVAAGCVDFVLSPAEIARELARISQHPYVAPGAGEPAEPRPGDSNLSPILEQLRATTGVDFSNYKRSTLHRRVTRRAVLQRTEKLSDYVRFLQAHPEEVHALYQDVLIGVTSFFRDPAAFEVLKHKVFPPLMKDRSAHEPVRVWSLGCSTGEEAYSIAMAFAEFASTSRPHVPMQIFATDLNGVGLEKARAGLYPKTIVQDVSPERLRRFFAESQDAYRITKALRDTTVFARHNVLTDPPFSRMDLISCRNLLIYLEPAVQESMMGALHYALKPHGVLWLGRSESLGSYRDHFEVEDAKERMYMKKPGTRLGSFVFKAADPARMDHEPQQPRQAVSAPVPDVHREADRILLAQYAPASVLVSADLEIVQYRGAIDRYLGPAPGKASLNLLKMLREGLIPGVRAAIQKAKRAREQVREEGLRVRSEGVFREVSVQVIPVPPREGGDPHYLVLFEDASGSAVGPRTARTSARAARDAQKARRGLKDSREGEITRLTHELAATREYLQSVIEQQEAANEELQSANEEVQSANEELQSINEELETSTEEVQSSNEELATLNEELRTRNLEVGLINDDFANLLTSVQLAIVILGPDLRIRRFTPVAEKMLNVTAADVGRPITDIQLGVEIPELEPILVEVMETVSPRECEVLDKHGRWYVLRVRPYRTMDGRIDGTVLVLHDVDALKRSQEVLSQQTELLEQAHEAIFIWELDGGITYWNRGAEATYGFTKDEALGRKSYELLSTSPAPSVFLDALATHGQWMGELIHVGRNGQRVVVDSRMSMDRAIGRGSLVFETNHVITEHKRLESTLRERADELAAADRNKDTFLALLAHELRNPLAPLTNALDVLTHRETPRPLAQNAGAIMRRQIRNMARLIDDLLDVSRMTQGRIELRKERVNLTTLVERAIEGTRHHTDARSQAITVSIPTGGLPVDVDPLRIEQVLGNLLSNASKFSGRGGQITLTVERHPSDTNTVVIRVKDTGIGIDPETLPMVFDLFMQADPSLSRSTGGLGIGLSLVRHLVELHGGSVEATSAGVGRGSEFVVRLPSRVDGPTDTLAPPIDSTPTPHVAARRVIVTDDNADAAEALAMVLRAAGHDVRVAHDGPSTLELATIFQPEIIFLDVGMPGQDGYETARQLRQRTALDGTLLVALTGYGRDADRQRARDAGFDEFLVKPAMPETVIALAGRARTGG